MVANFSWIIEGRVAGMGRPHEATLEWLRDQGVSAVVSLTEAPPAGLDGFAHVHLPVPDMTSPSLTELRAAVAFIQEHADKGVVVHCGAGLGRTGTVLAAYLVSTGASATAALRLNTSSSRAGPPPVSSTAGGGLPPYSARRNADTA